MENLHVVIGLEMHCELKSNSKVFSDGRNAYSDTANINVSPVDMAFPGILPVVNKYCVEEAIKMASILHCQIPDVMIFDRKNYYYPDLPKGYQITQCSKPVGINGYLEYDSGNKIKRAIIHDIHLEEDSASLDHLNNTSIIDYNRAGVPLLEVVTEPCFNCAKDAVSFLENMIKIYQYTNISDADTKRGQVRCDVNVSLANEKGEYVTPRSETKNVNSLGNIFATINYEEKRQREAYFNHSEELVQETRRFDEDTQTTIRMRTKVDAIDYKYFIEPNIPPFKIEKEMVDKIVNDIPELPLSRKQRYLNEYKLTEEDANTLIKNKDLSDYYDECIKIGIDKQIASNWVTVNILGELNKSNISIKDFYITPNYLKQITDNILNNNISSKQAKEIFAKSILENKEPNTYIKDNTQLSDESYLRDLIVSIINNNLAQKEAYLNGKTNLFDYFVGQVMKETKGKANPVITKKLLRDLLNK
ncbi:MAG: Asp-tRNA(Asn)/Glu-tRNA(Gln) amidotransferase subunit GatB [Bacilli bacterium]|nr:Asp-tRNA(Asn)/Glu-tRNA(Gln) amidotransferase subunit GatB [Bacilli bacterium]